MIFTIGAESVYAYSTYFKEVLNNSEIGDGEHPLDKIKSVINNHRDELQVCDIVTDYERDLSRVGFALFEGKRNGVETVSITSFGYPLN